MKNIVLIGAGSWGTALAKIILDSPEYALTWYIRRPDVANAISSTGRNPVYLSDIKLDSSRITTQTGLPELPENTDALVVALPAAFSGEVLEQLPLSSYAGPVISAAKGLIPKHQLTVTEWLELSGKVHRDNLFMIGGPCHSEEVAKEKRSYLTMAGNGILPLKIYTDLFNPGYISCSSSSDLRGVEFSAVLKNVMAVACGIALGTGCGDNFLSVLVSAAARETELFLNTHFSGTERDVNHSAYLGDLLVTCYSPHSRNRGFGMLVGRGYSPAEAKTEMAMVAEGYYAVKGLDIRFDLKGFPIIEMVYACMHEGLSAGEAIKTLQSQIH